MDTCSYCLTRPYGGTKYLLSWALFFFLIILIWSLVRPAELTISLDLSERGYSVSVPLGDWLSIPYLTCGKIICVIPPLLTTEGLEEPAVSTNLFWDPLAPQKLDLLPTPTGPCFSAVWTYILLFSLCFYIIRDESPPPLLFAIPSPIFSYCY